jgi:murein DD-endopeptidase MepM/ murein hydrolase activator NlpD
MARVTVYSPQVQQQAMTGAKQNPVSTGFGQAVGQGLEAVGQGLGVAAKERDQYLQRVDEAAALEADTATSEQLAAIEQRLLSAQGRNAMDARDDVEAEWVRTVDAGRAGLQTDRQRAAYDALARQRRDRWVGRATTHVARETEVYTAGQEDGHVANLARETAMLPVGSDERRMAGGQLSMALGAIAARRGLSPERREQLTLETYSAVHTATIQQLQNEQPDEAWAYLQENRVQIAPDTYARLMPQVREDRNAYVAKAEIEGFITRRSGERVTVDVEGETGTYEMQPPVAGTPRRSSGYGPRNAPATGGGRRGSSNHRGVDWAVPPNTPVMAALPGVARIRQDPDGFGTYVVVDHGGGRETIYAHLNGATIQDGQRVEQGQRIGLSGSSGNSSGPHLHFAVRVNGEYQNPDSALGRPTTVSGGAGAGVDFATVEDVEDYARERAGGDWRLEEAIRKAGMDRLQQRRAVRNDNENESRRAFDEWRASNPDATWEQAPARLRSSLSPGDRVTLRDQMTPNPEGEGGSELSNDVYIEALAAAHGSPERFATRDLRPIRDVLGEARYVQLSKMQLEIQTGAPDGARTAPRVLQTVRPVIDSYVNQVFRPAPTGGRPPDQATQIAAVNEGLLTWAEQYARQNRDNPNPTQDQVTTQLVLLLQRTRGSDGRERVFAARTPGSEVVIPDRVRRALTTALRRAGRPVNNETLTAAYSRYLQNPDAPTRLSPLANGR